VEVRSPSRWLSWATFARTEKFKTPRSSPSGGHWRVTDSGVAAITGTPWWARQEASLGCSYSDPLSICPAAAWAKVRALLALPWRWPRSFPWCLAVAPLGQRRPQTCAWPKGSKSPAMATAASTWWADARGARCAHCASLPAQHPAPHTPQAANCSFAGEGQRNTKAISSTKARPDTQGILMPWQPPPIPERNVCVLVG
jgi:hypothetical protein